MNVDSVEPRSLTLLCRANRPHVFGVMLAVGVLRSLQFARAAPHQQKRAAVPISEMTIDSRQPVWFEKNANIAPSCDAQ